MEIKYKAYIKNDNIIIDVKRIVFHQDGTYISGYNPKKTKYKKFYSLNAEILDKK